MSDVAIRCEVIDATLSARDLVRLPRVVLSRHHRSALSWRDEYGVPYAEPGHMWDWVAPGWRGGWRMARAVERLRRVRRTQP